jgi:hypothetical protein
METMQFEPMSVGRIFDRTFAIYRNNFLRFVTIVALIEVPVALLSTATSSWTQTKAAQPQTFIERMKAAREGAPPTSRPSDVVNEPAPSVIGVFGRALTFLLQLVGSMLCQAALIKNVSEAYLGNEITIGQAYRFALPKAVTLIAATICVGLVVGLGFLLLFVPGVIFRLWFFLTIPAIVMENRSATAGMSRSKALVAGNLGKVFAVGFLAFLIGLIVSFPLGYVGGYVGTAFFTENTALRVFLIAAATTVSQVLVMPIGAAASILLYYDLRIRKEGFDLQMLAQSMMSGQGEVRAS